LRCLGSIEGTKRIRTMRQSFWCPWMGAGYPEMMAWRSTGGGGTRSITRGRKKRGREGSGGSARGRRELGFLEVLDAALKGEQRDD
jgi:hypothetical protein